MAKNKKFVPRKERVTLNERMLPDVKNLKIGEETTIEVKVRVVAISEGREWGDLEGEDSYEEREYGKDYAEARRKEDSLKRATFVILSADEEGDDDKSPEQKAADRIMAEKRRKRVI